jgi:hypothetical protein
LGGFVLAWSKCSSHAERDYEGEGRARTRLEVRNKTRLSRFEPLSATREPPARPAREWLNTAYREAGPKEKHLGVKLAKWVASIRTAKADNRRGTSTVVGGTERPVNSQRDGADSVSYEAASVGKKVLQGLRDTWGFIKTPVGGV